VYFKIYKINFYLFIEYFPSNSVNGAGVNGGVNGAGVNGGVNGGLNGGGKYSN
jgi:hypothetical protein